jgi:hypothetical protein
MLSRQAGQGEASHVVDLDVAVLPPVHLGDRQVGKQRVREAVRRVERQAEEQPGFRMLGDELFDSREVEVCAW